MTDKELVELAITASKNSYSPYSKYRVGAALLCADGTVFTGCNVENASYGATNCAERTAVFSAAAHGYRKFLKIAIVGTSGDKFEKPASPCGTCRQVLSEFCDKDFVVLLFDGEQIIKLKFGELLPYPFTDF